MPPGAILVEKRLRRDVMAFIPHRFKVPYVVVFGTFLLIHYLSICTHNLLILLSFIYHYIHILGTPNASLYELIVDPIELLQRGTSYRLNTKYYIEKCINPSINRILSLCGVDIMRWYEELSRPKVRYRHHIRYEVEPENELIDGVNEIITVKGIAQRYFLRQ